MNQLATGIKPGPRIVAGREFAANRNLSPIAAYQGDDCDPTNHAVQNCDSLAGW